MVGKRIRTATGGCLLAVLLAVAGCAPGGASPLWPDGAAGSGDESADPAPGTPPITRIPVEGVGYPVSIGLSPDGARAYVLGTEGVGVLDTASRAVVATVPVPGGSTINSVAVSPDGTRVYVPTSRAIAVVDPAVGAVVSTVPLDDYGTTDVVASPDGSRLYTASSTTGQVTVLDVARGAVEATVQVDEYAEPKRLILTPDGRTLRVSTSTGVVEIDTASARITSAARIGDPGSILAMATSPDGARTYVSASFDRIGIVENGAQVGEVVIPDHSPGGLATSRDGALLFAAGHGMGGAQCSVVDTRTRTVAATFELGHASADVAFAPDADVVYAIDYNKGVSVVDLSAFG